jgi:RNA polymerase sigma-70 factor (ECF subfamily)
VSAPQKKAPVSRFPYERLGDAELVQAVVRGDSEAVGVVWDRYANLIRGVIRGSLGPDSSAEDLLQEVFIVFLRCAPELRDAGALRAFLVGVAVRIVSVELRRRRVRRWVALSPTGEVPDAPTAPSDTESAEVLRALYRLLEAMPARRRLAFVLRHVQGFEIPEVARALEVSESTVKREVVHARESILNRARTEPALSQYLERFRERGDEHA